MDIHTFEVNAKVCNTDYYDIQNDLKKDKDKWTHDKKSMTYFGLADKGIRIKFFALHKPDFKSKSITYIISARRVMENDNYVELFDTNDYDKLEKRVNKLLKSKSKLLPKLKQCTLRRIDFCINAGLDNQEQVKAYIHTAKRGNVPKGMELFMMYDKTAKRYKPTKDDMTVINDEYIAVSIYNKYRQMKKEEKMKYSDKDYERAQNIVRIEIRCDSAKIDVLNEKYGIATIEEFMSEADKIGDYLYRYYLPKIFNNGVVCTLKEAKKRIGMSEFKDENKELLTSFVEEVSSARSAAQILKIIRYIHC